MVVVGGVIPPQDYNALYEAGASAIFGPGTVVGKAALIMLDELCERLGYQPMPGQDASDAAVRG